MTDQKLSVELFPRFHRPIDAKWAPILLEPIAGSAERLVIGIAVSTHREAFVASVNGLRKLDCLYGSRGKGVCEIATRAVSYVQEQSFEPNFSLTEVDCLYSGVHIGEIRSGEGETLEQIANVWLPLISSLHENVVSHEIDVLRELVVTTGATLLSDQLASQVMNEVIATRSSLLPYFSSDLRAGRTRRTKNRAHEVMIDFSGSKLVANFDVLRISQLTKSVDSIKRKLWDLKVDRDREDGPIRRPFHELLIQAPALDGQVLNNAQKELVRDALGGLERQADQEELRLVQLGSAQAIAARVLELETT